MGLKGLLPNVFAEDVASVEDYMQRIEKIKKFCDKNDNYNFHFYFRGDRYCAKTQSNFFRYGNLADENVNFENWTNVCTMKRKGLCNCDEKGKFTCLAYMQHYQGNTRLLDFTTDAKVALRFACGAKGDNCRKKVTIYNTTYIGINDCNRDKRLNQFVQFVNSDVNLSNNFNIPTEDYFIEMPEHFPRIKRQKGLFLFMGNQTTSDLMKTNRDAFEKNQKKKVKHELSPTTGRGTEYEGYVGVLSISQNAVEQMRNELEQTIDYNMNYLMGEDICQN